MFFFLNAQTHTHTKCNTLIWCAQTSFNNLISAFHKLDNYSNLGKINENHFVLISTPQAYCDMETDGGGWTVFQRIMDGSVDFHLNWAHYVHGFGDVSGNYWLGLSKIHRLANSTAPQKLRVDLEDFAGNTSYAHYASFYIGGPSTDYVLRVKGYSGTAGDSLEYHHGSKFTTKDHGLNDGWCAEEWKGGWWYRSCYFSKLNGRYIVGGGHNVEGIVWFHWKKDYYSLKYADMKIRD